MPFFFFGSSSSSPPSSSSPSPSAASRAKHAPAPHPHTLPTAREDMSAAFVSKSRRVRFALTLRVLDLNNVPLVSGTSFVKWHLPSSTAAEHRGRTGKCPIRDHRVAYDYEKQLNVRLTVGKDGMLQECSVHFEITQEYNAGGRGERIRLGEVKLNLAEYVEASEAQAPASPGPSTTELRDEGVVRRYLMQESKINSTLKVGIYMRHIDGTRDYHAPALRSAPVFGGITGIISSSDPVSGAHAGPSSITTDIDGPESAVSNLINSNKETGEMQDMYRRTLAAFWTSQPGELKADECIEDIFSGGDGWGKNGRPETPNPRAVKQGVFGDATNPSRPGSGTTTPNLEHDVPPTARPKSSRSARHGMTMNTGRHAVKTGRDWKGKGEIDEFEVCDDLKSWRIDDRAYA